MIITVTQRVEFSVDTDVDYTWLKTKVSESYGNQYQITNDDLNKTVIIEKTSQETTE